MDGGSSLGMVITLVTVSLRDDSTPSLFSLRISLVQILLLPWAKKLFFSYSINLGFTERVEQLLISAVTLISVPGEKKTCQLLNPISNRLYCKDSLSEIKQTYALVGPVLTLPSAHCCVPCCLQVPAISSTNLFIKALGGTQKQLSWVKLIKIFLHGAQ